MISSNYVLKNNGAKQMNYVKNIFKIVLNYGNNTILYLIIKLINVAFVER